MLDKFEKIGKIFTAIKGFIVKLFTKIIPGFIKFINMNIKDKMKNKNKVYETIDIDLILQNIRSINIVVTSLMGDDYPGIAEAIRLKSLSNWNPKALQQMITQKDSPNYEWQKWIDTTKNDIMELKNLKFDDMINDNNMSQDIKYTELEEIRKTKVKYSYDNILKMYYRKPKLNFEKNIKEICDNHIEFIDKLKKAIDQVKKEIDLKVSDEEREQYKGTPYEYNDEKLYKVDLMQFFQCILKHVQIMLG